MITIFFYFIKYKPWHKHAKWLPSDLTPWTLTLRFPLMFLLFSEKNMNCINVNVLCNDIMDDYNTANNLVMEFPDQIIFLRYETLTYHPYKTLDVLFDFLNLIPDSKLDEYLASR